MWGKEYHKKNGHSYSDIFPTHYGYNGKRFDPKVGLYDYGFRDYKPDINRWTTIDPIHSGKNWYAYVENDPVNWVDPFGLMPEVPGDGTVVDPDDGLSAAEKDLAASRELSIKDEEIMKETLHKQELVGIAEIVVGGIGIFAGGNVPAAFVMADGAIRYTKAKYAKEFYSTRDSIRFISELSTPAVKNLAEELWERHDD